MSENKPCFNREWIESAPRKYVAWVDIMGMQNYMARSINVASNFVFKFQMMGRYLIRGAVARGQIVSGASVYSVAEKTTPTEQLTELASIRDTVSVGMPISQAYSGEKYAPPFGIFVHESARSTNFCSQKWLRLFDNYEERTKFKKEVEGYFAKCINLSCFLDYKKDRIEEHQKLFAQYMTLHGESGNSNAK